MRINFNFFDFSSVHTYKHWHCELHLQYLIQYNDSSPEQLSLEERWNRALVHFLFGLKPSRNCDTGHHGETYRLYSPEIPHTLRQHARVAQSSKMAMINAFFRTGWLKRSLAALKNDSNTEQPEKL